MGKVKREGGYNKKSDEKDSFSYVGGLFQTRCHD
jgi:hypothetical protein